MTSDRDGGDGDWVDPSRPFLDRGALGDRLPAPGGRPTPGRPGAEPEEDDPGTVRPYLLTGGRTASRPDVNVETIVSLTGAPAPVPLGEEQLALLQLAREPLAVAELAAYLQVPIGVTMVLVGDLAEAGLLQLHASSVGAREPAGDATLLRKVVNGVLRLRDAETI